MNAQELGKFVAYRDAVLIFPFIEGRGSKLHDFSRYGNHGTIHGATWTQGKFGKALSFDGVDDYVDVGNPSSLQITGDLTIVWWFKPTNIGKGRQNPIDKAYGGEFAFTLEPDGGLSYYHGSAGKEGGTYWNKFKVWPSGTFKDNTWYFVAFVRNAETRTAWGYVDGNLIWSDSWTSDVDPSVSSEPVTIGNGYAGTFQGIIDEVRIYNRALSEEEIKCLYLNSFKKPEPTCVTRRGVYRAVKNEGIELTGNSLKCVEAMV